MKTDAAGINLPGREECKRILDRWHTPMHVRRHSMLVRDVAVFLGKKLRDGGIDIDIDLLECAGILHDVLKLADFRNLDFEFFDNDDVTEEKKEIWKRQYELYKGKGHEELAYDMLSEKHPGLALVIKRHRFAAIKDMDTEGWSWEEKILTYADKRVAHDKIVTLKERFTEGHKRYGNKGFDDHNPNDTDRRYFELEKEIFDIIGLDPGRLAGYMMDEALKGKAGDKALKNDDGKRCQKNRAVRED